MIRPRTITAANTSQETMRLMRTMAIANIQREMAEASKEEVQRYKTPTEEIMLLFAALDIAITDVAQEFASVGLYRHAVKRELNEIERIVLTTYKALYAKLQKVEKPITRKAYDYWMVRVSDAIDNSILLTPPRRSYNIAVALARLIVKRNDSLGRFIVAEAHPLRHVVTRLERINVVEDHHIDFIIERTIKALWK